MTTPPMTPPPTAPPPPDGSPMSPLCILRLRCQQLAPIDGAGLQCRADCGRGEGKDGKGLFPASCDFTTDLHSMGQWIQDGERTIFETCISVENPERSLLFPHDEENLDGLNFLAGKRIDEVNKNAELGTRLAHVDGGVPNILISIERLDAYNFGQLIYFFEIACGISGQLLGVNAFNQPGVEAYKKNMFALLEKPGYEAETAAIKARLAAE